VRLGSPGGVGALEGDGGGVVLFTWEGSVVWCWVVGVVV